MNDRIKVLFCSDALLIDGVTSYILHVGIALKRAGYDVAVLGRWAGTGFQKRMNEEGIKVIQCPSFTIGNFWFDIKAKQFNPDVIMSDSRRSFPLATRLKKKLNKPVVTYFLDHLDKTNKKGRDIESLRTWSDLWVGAEEPILQSLKKVAGSVPVMTLSRPLSVVLESYPLNSAEKEFNLVCFGRLSGYKTPGMFHVLENIKELKDYIPNLKVTIVGGGGWRVFKFKKLAKKINNKLGTEVICVTGIQPDPKPWIEKAHLICAGSTSAIEGALAKRPVICFTGYWLGHVVPDNMEYAMSTYFGERSGYGLIANQEYMNKIIPEIKKVYDDYNKKNKIQNDLQHVRDYLFSFFNEKKAIKQFEDILEQLNLV